jgi:hypothetical protein
MSKSTGNHSGNSGGNNSNQGNKTGGGFGCQEPKTRNADRGNSNITPDKKGLGQQSNTEKKGNN